MRVSDIRVVLLDDTCKLQAVVHSDNNQPPEDRFESFEVWYRFPVWCSDFLTPENGEPFLAALLPIAMMTSQPRTIDAPVPAKLWRALPEIQSVYGCFDKGHS